MSDENYTLWPYRPDRRSRERRANGKSLERTRFRAAGVVLKTRGERAWRLADYCLAVAVMGTMLLGFVVMVGIPLLYLWRFLSWLL